MAVFVEGQFCEIFLAPQTVGGGERLPGECEESSVEQCTPQENGTPFLRREQTREIFQAESLRTAARRLVGEVVMMNSRRQQGCLSSLPRCCTLGHCLKLANRKQPDMHFDLHGSHAAHKKSR